MRKHVVVICLLSSAILGAGEKQSIPKPNYHTDLHLAGVGPDANGVTGKMHIIDPFTLLEQPLGAGKYVDMNFRDGCILKIDTKNGLKVNISKDLVWNDVHWCLWKSGAAILFGKVTDFQYGGPDGISSGILTADSKVYEGNRYANALILPKLKKEDIPTNAITVAAWIYLERDNNDRYEIFVAANPNDVAVCRAEVLAGKDQKYRFIIRGNNGGTIKDLQIGPITYDAWVHYAGVYDYDKNVVKIYINGQELASAATDLHDMIGCDWAGGAKIGNAIDVSRSFVGMMDNFYVFKRALSPQEIAHLAEVPKPDNIHRDKKIDLKDVVTYYDFDDPIATAVPDKSGHDYNAIVPQYPTNCVLNSIIGGRQGVQGNAVYFPKPNEWVDYKSGAYQGNIQNGDGDCSGKLLYPKYKLIWYHATRTGKLVPIP